MRSRGIQSPVLPNTNTPTIPFQGKQRKSIKSSFITTLRFIGKTGVYVSLLLLFMDTFLHTNMISHVLFFFGSDNIMSQQPDQRLSSPCPNQTQQEEELYLQLEESQTAIRELETIYERRLKEMRDKLSGKELESQQSMNQTTVTVQQLDTKINTLEKNTQLFQQQNDYLKTYIANTDYKRALEVYGPGPHYVEFVLDFLTTVFDPPRDDQNTTTRFVIEMAPLNLMPHTVFLFLQQVSHGLFNGTSFYRNAGHVVQGGPVPYYKNPGEALLKKYREAGLDRVAFQEYHPKYPHVKYTLGTILYIRICMHKFIYSGRETHLPCCCICCCFRISWSYFLKGYAGRPGGTDFYVSTIGMLYVIHV